MTRKRIQLCIDPDLLSRLDGYARLTQKKRSAVIEQALTAFLTDRRSAPVYSLKELEEGYRSMGTINLTLAEEALSADNEQFTAYEHFLSESETS